jgi:pimeloyl-ACP methyl ester carboxylesterase
MKTVQHHVPNGAGHRLALFQTYDEATLDRTRNPVVIVPGYGMNSFIFSYHPTGVSLEGYLAAAGFEVWRADLRGQGESMAVGGSDNYTLEDLALTDVRVVLEAAGERTLCTARGTHKVDVIGCSLGGTLMFIHAVLMPHHNMGALVSMGSPVRWEKAHPLVRLAFSSPMVAGMIKVKGTRKIARWALPHLVKHTPWLLSVYMNPEITDTSAIGELVRTVEDPNRHINREIAKWVRDRDLVVRRVNIGEGLQALQNPLLCICANGDGVVPVETASYAYHQVGSRVKALLEVGTAEIAMAHADLFISREAHERVFRPLAGWLLDQNQARTNR